MKKRTDADGAAREFYSVWTNFATEKEFTWEETWRLSEAPDRRVRRAMEKENKKTRDDARREYNDTVRSLAKFVRKRDPRFQKYQRELDEIAKSKVASNTAPRPSTTTAADFVEQEWQKLDPNAHGHADLEWGVAENDNEEEWECVACGKSFRSEAAWDSHERSKKHLKAIEQLRREMEVDDEALELQEDEEGEGSEAEPTLSGEEDDEEYVDAGAEVEGAFEANGKGDVPGANTSDEEELGAERDSWDCAACEKSFKTQGAWESHERNKKHQKALQEYLKAQRSTNSSSKPSKASTPIPQPHASDIAPSASRFKGKKANPRTAPPQPDFDDDDDSMPMSKTQRKAQRKAKLAEFSETQSQAQSQVPSGMSTPLPPAPGQEEEAENGQENEGEVESAEPMSTSKKAKRKETGKEKVKPGGTGSVSAPCSVWSP